METIKSKRALHSAIKNILENCPEENIAAHQEITFREGMSQTVFKFVIDRIEEDFFVDDKGQKWVRA